MKKTDFFLKDGVFVQNDKYILKALCEEDKANYLKLYQENSIVAKASSKMSNVDYEEFAEYAVAVKSGPSVFNADSKKRQEQNFTAASKLAQQAKARYEAYIGYCYGKKKESGRGKPKMYQELAGKKFWAELTGDEEFYKKIITFMGTMPEQYVASYKESYNKAANRLLREFATDFCKEDGSIDWEKLVEFNSGD